MMRHSPGARAPQLFTSLTLLIFAADAGAATLIGNLPPGGIPADQISATSTISSAQKKAVGFTTPNDALTVESVSLWLVGLDNLDVPDFNIRADVGSNSPADSRAVVSLGAISPTPTSLGAIDTFTMTPQGNAALQPNTLYWLLLDTADGDFNWAVPFPNVTPTGTATFEGFAFSEDGGTSYSESNILNTFEIVAADAPAPVPIMVPMWTMALLFGGLLRIAQRRRQR